MSFGFILLRNIKSYEDNKLWLNSYLSIRKFYPEIPIMIINDNCDKSVIINIEMTYTTEVDSEYPGAAEILPYYYLHKYKFFDKAVILFDSMIIREFIDFENMNLKDVIYLGDFPPWCDYPDKVQEMINSLPNKETLNHIFTHNKWKGCFGGCSFITLKYLELIQEKYNMFSLIPYLQSHREYRHSFERVFGILCSSLSDTVLHHQSICTELQHIVIHKSQFNNMDQITKYYPLNKSIAKIGCGR
jgi:hypothetical protein